MSFLPIVGRELRVASRRLGTYWTRVAMAAGATAIGACILLFSLNVPPQKVGYYIFVGLAGLSMLFCLAYGRHATADCLSSEKREGTLGLLFLTDLKGHDVVLGKLAATSMGGFYGLLAMFPVMAIPVLMGGITSGEFWRIALVLVNTFLFSLSVGIMVSSMSWDARTAIGANLLVLLFLIGIPPAIAFVTVAIGRGPLPTDLFLSCPVYSFYLSFAGRYWLHWQDFWRSVALVHALTWLMLALACRIAPHGWQDRPQTNKTTWKGRWRSLAFGNVAGQKAFRQQALDINAFYWLAARARLKPLQVWAFLAGMGVWWLVGWATSGRMWLEGFVYVITALLLNTTFKIWLMIEAGQRLAEDHRAGALELLLSTPLTVRDIIRGQWLALRRQFARPLLVVLAVEFSLLVIMGRRTGDPEIVPVWVAGMIMLLVDLVAAGWVAMWLALKAKNPHQATLGTIIRLLILPWIIIGAITGVLGIWFQVGLSRSWNPTWKFYLTLWVGLGLVVDLAFGLMARAKLLGGFRQLALQQLAPGVGTSGVLHRGKVEAQRKPKSVSKERHPHLSRPACLARHKKIFVPLSACLVLAVLWAFGVLPRSSALPPPPLVSIAQSNAAVRIFPANPGLFLILPDHSLWCWGSWSSGQSNQSTLTQVGTDFDWVKVVATRDHFLGLRTNGTLWRCAMKGPDIAAPPVLFDQGRDWIDVAALRSGSYVLALRRDGSLWEWGKSLPGRAGAGIIIPGQSPPVQVGTNTDWAEVSSYLMSAVARRKDHSLWVWGLLYTLGPSSGMIASETRLAVPTRLCQETNWSRLIESIPMLAHTSSGEAWEMTGRPPAEEGPTAAVCRLLATNAPAFRFVTALSGDRKAYEIRADGSLWERECPLTTQSPVTVDEWRRVGRRSDWVSLDAAGATALGLTADGTLWMWGYDPSQSARANFSGTLKIIQARLSTVFSGKPVSFGIAGSPRLYQKEPRPILRMVLSRAVPPFDAGRAVN